MVAYSCRLTVLQHGEPRKILATVFWDDQAGIEPGWAYSFAGVSRGGPLEEPGEKPIRKSAGLRRLTKALKAALAWEGLEL